MSTIPAESELLFHHISCIPSPDDFPRHMHGGYELLYFLRGDVDFAIEGAVYRLRERDLLLIAPRTYHCLLPRSSVEYERFVINFSEQLLPYQARQALADASGLYHLPADHAIPRFYRSWQDAEEIFTKEELERLVRMGPEWILPFLYHLPRAEDARPVRRNRPLQSILRYIDEHPTEHPTAASLSAAFYVSPSWIVHTFRRELGINLTQYVARKRILYAQSLIQSGEAPTSVAVTCGYESYVTFYRQYRRILSHCPKDDLPRDEM